MGQKPGVMLYFDIRPALKRLSQAEKGQLFEAILAYGEYGAIPDFEGMVGVAWDFIQPRIDLDNERYSQTVEARKSAADNRWRKSAPMQTDANDANAVFALQTMPTATPAPTPAPAAKPTPKSKSAAAAAGGVGDTAAASENDLEKRKTAFIEILRNGTPIPPPPTMDT